MKAKYFIRPSGKGDFLTFHLIESETFEMLDVFFSSEEDALEYANKKSLLIVDYNDISINTITEK